MLRPGNRPRTEVGSGTVPYRTPRSVKRESVLPETGEGGLRYVDETKLTELGLYPLQLKTVRLLAALAVLGLLALAAAFWLTLRWRRRAAPQNAGR